MCVQHPPWDQSFPRIQHRIQHASKSNKRHPDPSKSPANHQLVTSISKSPRPGVHVPQFQHPTSTVAPAAISGSGWGNKFKNDLIVYISRISIPITDGYFFETTRSTPELRGLGFWNWKDLFSLDVGLHPRIPRGA